MTPAYIRLMAKKKKNPDKSLSTEPPVTIPNPSGPVVIIYIHRKSYLKKSKIKFKDGLEENKESRII